MAGDWIKMQTRLWDHPKVVRIVSAICPQGVRNLSLKCQVIGALFRTWSLADAHSDDGVLDGYDYEALDAAVGIDGWAENLQHVGWLIIETQRLIVPRFEEHNSSSSKRRAEDAKRKKSVRKMSEKCPQASGQNADQRREEKRREDSSSLEKKNQEKQTQIPATLTTPEFESAWADWKRHRREIKKALTPTQEAKQLKTFAEWGPARAIAAIEYTILKGWQGIREPEVAAAPSEKKSKIMPPEQYKFYSATTGVAQ